ncbi:MAG: hypothetical protein CM1200mP4_5300 [Rhodospirillaceae bacterium]|nr:MAG: hypothetical protein CM1200mP4_5300 [Rhodospirillaceae bacterium]
MDEPTAGMSPGETKRMLSIINSFPAILAVLIVEHDMDVVFQVSRWITVLDEGRYCLKEPQKTSENQKLSAQRI